MEYCRTLTNPAKKEYGIIIDGKDSWWYGNYIGYEASTTDGFNNSWNMHVMQRILQRESVPERLFLFTGECLTK